MVFLETLKSINCFVFGHKRSEGWQHGLPYFKSRHISVDGMGQVHATLYDECSRCGKEYPIGMVHLPSPEETK